MSGVPQFQTIELWSVTVTDDDYTCDAVVSYWTSMAMARCMTLGDSMEDLSLGLHGRLAPDVEWRHIRVSDADGPLAERMSAEDRDHVLHMRDRFPLLRAILVDVNKDAGLRFTRLDAGTPGGQTPVRDRFDLSIPESFGTPPDTLVEMIGAALSRFFGSPPVPTQADSVVAAIEWALAFNADRIADLEDENSGLRQQLAALAEANVGLRVEIGRLRAFLVEQNEHLEAAKRSPASRGRLGWALLAGAIAFAAQAGAIVTADLVLSGPDTTNEHGPASSVERVLFENCSIAIQLDPRAVATVATLPFMELTAEE